ncbi:MAG: hypothetical protein RR574_20095, partial [Comamonas sp.]
IDPVQGGKAADHQNSFGERVNGVEVRALGLNGQFVLPDFLGKSLLSGHKKTRRSGWFFSGLRLQTHQPGNVETFAVAVGVLVLVVDPKASDMRVLGNHPAQRHHYVISGRSCFCVHIDLKAVAIRTWYAVEEVDRRAADDLPDGIGPLYPLWRLAVRVKARRSGAE